MKHQHSRITIYSAKMIVSLHAILISWDIDLCDTNNSLVKTLTWNWRFGQIFKQNIVPKVEVKMKISPNRDFVIRTRVQSSMAKVDSQQNKISESLSLSLFVFFSSRSIEISNNNCNVIDFDKCVINWLLFSNTSSFGWWETSVANRKIHSRFEIWVFLWRADLEVIYDWSTYECMSSIWLGPRVSSEDQSENKEKGSFTISGQWQRSNKRIDPVEWSR